MPQEPLGIELKRKYEYQDAEISKGQKQDLQLPNFALTTERELLDVEDTYRGMRST